RGPINALMQDAKNPSWLVAEQTLPDDVGGWYVREAGIWTDTGILYAVIKYPESFKPVISSGSGKEFYLRAISETSNAANVVLAIDDTIVKATRAWVVD
ncbi:phage tail protein, partial [Pseudomonas viridiflava]|uniref:phage tail protein n=1 Tax=Pseudomonas viridiflava TaxID=33069 RepID=UPI0013CF099F